MRIWNPKTNKRKHEIETWLSSHDVTASARTMLRQLAAQQLKAAFAFPAQIFAVLETTTRANNAFQLSAFRHPRRRRFDVGRNTYDIIATLCAECLRGMRRFRSDRRNNPVALEQPLTFSGARRKEAALSNRKTVGLIYQKIGSFTFIGKRSSTFEL